jgi:hypothetical protein
MIIRDGDWTLVDSDLKLKRFVWARQNPDGSTTYRTDYGVDDTIEANKTMMADASKDWKGDWHKVASIPLGVYYDKLHAASLQDDQAFISKFLNDSDNRAWRTKGGKV